MIVNNGNYLVYCHTLPNNKHYIGITKQKLNRRFQNGLGYINCKRFYNAIKKYGWENIETDVIASNLTKIEAENFEKILIKKFNLRNDKYGYNIVFGGNVNVGLKHSDKTKEKIRNSKLGTGVKKVRCITTDKTFDSIKDACLFYKCSQKHMSETINGTRKFNGVYNGLKLKWEYVVN